VLKVTVLLIPSSQSITRCCLRLQVDEQLRAEDVEVYYDPGELLGGLIKGPEVASSEEERAERLSEGGNPSEAATVSASGADQPPQGCPFFSAGKTK
jgi:hypothetical protein